MSSFITQHCEHQHVQYTELSLKEQCCNSHAYHGRRL